MEQYEAIGLVSLFTGNLLISNAQFKRRAHLLKRLKTVSDEKVLTEIVKGPVHFKIGEKFSYDGDLPKAMAANLVEVSEEDSEINDSDLTTWHWKKLKSAVEDAGGTWTNRENAIMFLDGLR